jgi:hypothetical protein
MCILYFIAAGLTVMGALIALIDRLLYSIGSLTGRVVAIVILQLGVAVLLFFLGTYLKDTANAYKKFGRNPHYTEPLESAIYFQKGFWKMISIFILIILGVLLLSLIMFVMAIG